MSEGCGVTHATRVTSAFQLALVVLALSGCAPGGAAFAPPFATPSSHLRDVDGYAWSPYQWERGEVLTYGLRILASASIGKDIRHREVRVLQTVSVGEATARGLLRVEFAEDGTKTNEGFYDAEGRLIDLLTMKQPNIDAGTAIDEWSALRLRERFAGRTLRLNEPDRIGTSVSALLLPSCKVARVPEPTMDLTFEFMGYRNIEGVTAAEIRQHLRLPPVWIQCDEPTGKQSTPVEISVDWDGSEYLDAGSGRTVSHYSVGRITAATFGGPDVFVRIILVRTLDSRLSKRP
jgi:hypothetical protein